MGTTSLPPHTADRVGTTHMQHAPPSLPTRVGGCRRRLSVLPVLLMSVFSAAPGAQAHDPAAQPDLRASVDGIELRAAEVLERFMTALRDCGVEPAFEPKIVVRTHPGMIAYFPGEQSVHLSRWADLPAPITGTLAAWAAEGTLGLSAEQQFAEVFHSLLLPHELGHYLQHASGRLARLDRWASEVEANRIAIAFWQLDPAEAQRLPARIDNFIGFLGNLPSPVPDGSEPREYFNANYERLGDDGPAYGWYMGGLMRTAWQERSRTDFCALAKLNRPM